MDISVSRGGGFSGATGRPGGSMRFHEVMFGVVKVALWRNSRVGRSSDGGEI